MNEAASDPSIDEMTYLARSHHRIHLLTELSTEERTRRDLQETSGISQPTLGRILGDFEDRNWVSNNHDGTYSLTPLGGLLADAVEDLLDVLETISELTVLADRLPMDELEFDLHHLTDARVTTPTAAAPLGHMRRFDRLADGANNVKMFSNVISCTPAEDSTGADQELLSNVDELVVTDAAAHRLDDPDLERWLQQRIENGTLSMYRYDESAAFLFGIFDETVAIVPIDDGGMPCGLIESATDPIRTWAEETFLQYRQNATRLASDVIPQ